MVTPGIDWGICNVGVDMDDELTIDCVSDFMISLNARPGVTPESAIKRRFGGDLLDRRLFRVLNTKCDHIRGVTIRRTVG